VTPDDPALDNTENDDEPLGVPADADDPEDAPLPGIPEGEPPISG
jgi:hypothetical protein